MQRTVAISIVLAALACRIGPLAVERQPTHEETLPPPHVASELALEDLEQMTLEHNPTLVQAAMQVEISRGEAILGWTLS